MMLRETLVPLLVYPGALWIVALVALLLAGLGRGERRRGGLRQAWRALRGRGSLPHALSLAFALAALALLPWPQSPYGPLPNQDLWRLWALTEASFLAALLPGLFSSVPAVSRAATREAQIGVSGRAALWIALLVGYRWSGTTLNELAPLLLGAFAALLALPAAASWQPFGGESGLGLGNADAHLPPGDVALAHLARDVRSVLLVTFVATVFVVAPTFVWWQQVGLKVWLAFATVLVGRGLYASTVHRTLPIALRYCWLIVVPLAAIALAGRVWMGV